MFKPTGLGESEWNPTSIKAMFGSGKYKGKKKNAKENDFLMFDCPIFLKYQRKSNIIKTN